MFRLISIEDWWWNGILFQRRHEGQEEEFAQGGSSVGHQICADQRRHFLPVAFPQARIAQNGHQRQLDLSQIHSKQNNELKMATACHYWYVSWQRKRYHSLPSSLRYSFISTTDCYLCCWLSREMAGSFFRSAPSVTQLFMIRLSSGYLPWIGWHVILQLLTIANCNHSVSSIVKICRVGFLVDDPIQMELGEEIEREREKEWVYFELFDIFETAMAHPERRCRLVDGIVVGPGKNYSASAAAAAFLLLAPRPEYFLQLEHLPENGQRRIQSIRRLRSSTRSCFDLDISSVWFSMTSELRTEKSPSSQRLRHRRQLAMLK